MVTVGVPVAVGLTWAPARTARGSTIGGTASLGNWTGVNFKAGSTGAGAYPARPRSSVWAAAPIYGKASANSPTIAAT